MQAKKILFLLYVLCIMQLATATAQNRSNRGKEFWLCYGYNWGFTSELPINAQELAVYISTEQAATVTVSVFGTTWTRTLNIPANTVDNSFIVGQGNYIAFINVAGTAGAFSITGLGANHPATGTE